MLDIYKAPVNNVGLDPIQGFDIAAWVQDSATGQLALFGDFQSITLTIRDSTETYLPLGTRFPVYLNGEVQIAFVIEQGLVDMNFLQRTFGVQNMTREQLVTRGPRFQLTWDANAYELASNYVGIASNKGAINPNIQYTGGGTTFNQIVGGSTAQYAANNLRGDSSRNGLTTNNPSYDQAIPLAQGRYELQRCKIDSLSVGIMPGRRVIAQRWEGVAEGIRFIPQSLQDFRGQLGASGALGPAEIAFNSNTRLASTNANAPDLTGSAIGARPQTVF